MAKIFKQIQKPFAFLFSKHPDYYWKQLLAYMSLLVVVVFVGGRFLKNSVIPIEEGFEQKKEFVLELQESSYDSFYAEIYEQLHPTSPDSVHKIIRYIEKETQPSKDQSIFLEVGCGTGNCMYQLQEKGYQVTGMDQSIAMIEQAKDCCGTKTQFETKNVLTSSQTFEENTFSHILCLGPTTLYEICSPKSTFLNQQASITSHLNLEKFLGHMKRWLKRGGYLIIQIEPLSTLSQSWVSITGGKTSYSPSFPKRISHPDDYSTEIRFSEVDYHLEMTPSIPSFASTSSTGSFLEMDEKPAKSQSQIVMESNNIHSTSETIILKETFSNRSKTNVRQNEWHLTSPYSDTQDWIQAIQNSGFVLTKAAAIPYPNIPMTVIDKENAKTHAPIPQIYLFQKI